MSDQPFHEWLRHRARSAGYDVDSPKGARTLLAERAGMSISQIGRTLAGDTMPAADTQVRLARVLKIPLGEMFTRSGLIQPDERAQVEDIEPVIGPIDIAEHYGVAPEQQALFLDIVDNIAWSLKTERDRLAKQTSAS